MDLKDLKEAHKHCGKNRDEIEQSNIIACFYCKGFYSPPDIKEWCDSGKTAICPCGIDSVIGDASGIELTDKFLSDMHDYWFIKLEDIE